MFIRCRRCNCFLAENLREQGLCKDGHPSRRCLFLFKLWWTYTVPEPLRARPELWHWFLDQWLRDQGKL